jgi:type II secretory pathway pseudopilin PulG
MEKKTRLLYIEILVIAVILGVVGRTIAARFKGASAETKISNLVDGLETMRAHLDLYRVCHGGRFPPVDSFAGFEAAVTTEMGQYRPFVKKVPTNPFNNFNTVRFDGEPAGADKAGWRLDTRTGLFQADNGACYAAL